MFVVVPGLGRESEEAVKPHMDEIKVDALGNMITFKQGRANGDRLKVMASAHMDEKGFAR